ncbi:MAG: 3'-5' exonuclease [Methanobrevibacter sp.]|nr:3'-5' exonuclease [Methanobrevibacter sp.]
MKVIYFDTETTGLNCKTCQIIELAMLTVIDGEITDTYDEFINIGCQLPPKITQITGITDKMLCDEGISERSVAEDLKNRLTPGTLMVAHNCQFDLSFVYFLLKRHFPEEADEIVGNVGWIDTLTVLKDRKDYPHKLIDAVENYAVEKVNFHRAIDDTKALYHVTLAMKKERNDLIEYKNIFGFNPKWGIGGYRFSFIKYQSQPYHNRGFLPYEDILPEKVNK